MKVQNQRYQFVPPGGDSADPIQILGLQEYSPGQSQKVDVWLLKVPDQYHKFLKTDMECDSFGEVLRILAHLYFDGDIAKAENAVKTL